MKRETPKGKSYTVNPAPYPLLGGSAAISKVSLSTLLGVIIISNHGCTAVLRSLVECSKEPREAT